MLAKRGGDYSALTAVAKAKALLHNRHDCIGLREVVMRCVPDRP